MALKNETDPQQAQRNLSDWLKTKLPDAEVTGVEIPSSNGMSNETVLFDASWSEPDGGGQRSERLVARVEPAGPAVFPTYDVSLEGRVMSALAKTPVPVPKVMFYEEDSAVLGAPFLVVGFLAGRVPADDPPHTAEGWVLDLAEDERALLYDNGLKVMADLHAADWRSLGLEELDRPELGEDSIEQQLAFYEEFFEWAAEGESFPTIEAGFEWVRDNRPDDEGERVICWNDARVGNMIFRDDLSVAAALDWELVSLGPRGVDVSWWLFMQRFFTEGVGAPLPSGYPTADEMLARYEELSGQAVEHIDFHEGFSALKMSVMMVRGGRLMVSSGLLPPESTMAQSNSASQLLAKMLDLPAPVGATENFMGNR